MGPPFRKNEIAVPASRGCSEDKSTHKNVQALPGMARISSYHEYRHSLTLLPTLEHLNQAWRSSLFYISELGLR